MTEESPRLEARRHGIVLAGPLLRALALAAAGGACFLAPWRPAAVAGAALLALAAVLAVAAVVRWDRTRLVLTRDTLLVEHGLLRRRSASVALGPGAVVEVERTLLGRLLGYGTVVAGELEVDGVPRRLARALLQRG
ncbi:MAG TPA: PH domain-containing protein [Gaiellaceae bacterium]|nr:PH domain-containing protein [Gaiellaceae bacterium]